MLIMPRATLEQQRPIIRQMAPSVSPTCEASCECRQFMALEHRPPTALGLRVDPSHGELSAVSHSTSRPRPPKSGRGGPGEAPPKHDIHVRYGHQHAWRCCNYHQTVAYRPDMPGTADARKGWGGSVSRSAPCCLLPFSDAPVVLSYGLGDTLNTCPFDQTQGRWGRRNGESGRWAPRPNPNWEGTRRFVRVHDRFDIWPLGARVCSLYSPSVAPCFLICAYMPPNARTRSGRGRGGRGPSAKASSLAQTNNFE